MDHLPASAIEPSKASHLAISISCNPSRLLKHTCTLKTHAQWSQFVWVCVCVTHAHTRSNAGRGIAWVSERGEEESATRIWKSQSHFYPQVHTEFSVFRACCAYALAFIAFSFRVSRWKQLWAAPPPSPRMTNPPIKVFPSEPQKPNQRFFFF